MCFVASHLSLADVIFLFLIIFSVILIVDMISFYIHFRAEGYFHNMENILMYWKQLYLYCYY